MYVVYVIQNSATKQIYFGKTNNFKRRLLEHNSGKQTSTRRKNGEWILVYAEAYRDKRDADMRELKLKQHGNNKRWLKDRIQFSMLVD